MKTASLMMKILKMMRMRMNESVNPSYGSCLIIHTERLILFIIIFLYIPKIDREIEPNTITINLYLRPTCRRQR